MFEGLIEFAEDVIFSLFNQIMSEPREARTRCFHLSFALLQGQSKRWLGEPVASVMRRLVCRCLNGGGEQRITWMSSRLLRQVPLAQVFALLARWPPAAQF